MTDVSFDIIDDEQAETIKEGARGTGWLDALADGKMIRMSHVPTIGSGIKKRTGKNAKLRSLPATPPESGFYLWVELFDRAPGADD